MGKEKFTIKCTTRKTSRKTSHLEKKAEQKVKSGRKSVNGAKSEGKEFDDMESLVVLNNPKEKKKVDEIDERIKFLKTELKSLLGDIKTEKHFDNVRDQASLVSNTLLNPKGTRPNFKTETKSKDTLKGLKKSQPNETNEFKQTLNSTPLGFSGWLDKTVDDMNSESENVQLTAGRWLSNLKPQIAFETPSLNSLPIDSQFTSSNLGPLSQEKIEHLLYKSLLMKNSEVDFSSSEAIGLEVNKSTAKTKRNSKSKNFNTGRPLLKNLHSYKELHRHPRGMKRRMLNSSASHSDVEVISLDSSSGSNTMAEINTICMDLDISNYDWSEPFEINKETQLLSDFQIIEDSREKNNYINCKEIKSNNSELTEGSACHDESGNIDAKVWECPVCFERSKGQQVVATQCGHLFCRTCLENHCVKLSKNCPFCRSDLTDKPFIPLLNF